MFLSHISLWTQVQSTDSECIHRRFATLLARAHTKAERAPLRHGRACVEQQANEAALAPAFAKVRVKQTVLEEAETALAVCARDQ